ncbi:DUF6318 family protein [Kribbella sp. NPDC050124]|uniref:DUF6318 family protein n=1 Tax=Kribbella sp. NPDC050124 TaxID=3364114 RepID=UPI0037A8EE90
MTNRNKMLFNWLTAAVSATTLVACSPGSPEAGRPNTDPPTNSGSPSTTISVPSSPPATTPPQRPEAAVGLTLSAGEAFVKYYVGLLNYASTTGDVQPLLSASEGGCRQCKVYANYVQGVNAANGGLSGDYVERVTDVPDLFRGDSGRLGGYAAVTIGAYTSKDSPSAKPVTSTVRKYKREFTLSPQQGSWVMYEMELVPQ